ncbi:hypothetical protein [Bradyrhizobium sp. B120]|uniref:hypothetical protein n=1 Tax=Bradyrhizobium sp. B120 TaxID=3410088 RepID=UPI003B980B86
MTARRQQHDDADRRTPASTHAADIWTSVERWPPVIIISCSFVLKHGLAHSCEGVSVGEGYEQAATERWRDKRPQCAARSVGCLCFHFSLIPQCAASECNVRLTINSLWAFGVSHIAEVGHG